MSAIIKSDPMFATSKFSTKMDSISSRRRKLPVCAMNGGDGPYSYIQNSSYQRGVLDTAKPIIEEEIAKKFDTNHAASTLCIADFGCSTGHNSFPAIQFIIDAIDQAYRHKSSKLIPGFSVLFNDVVSNDFNTLFRSLPAHRGYRAAGVPGDFHGPLLAPSSLHFAYSSWALQWLTEAPKAANRGRILYSEDRKEVCDAYLEQFEKDMEAFLEARAAELVEGGLMALVIPGSPASWDPQREYTIPCDINLLGSCLMDLAKEGKVSEAMIDSFNIPKYFPTLEQLETILQRMSHTFHIQRFEIVNNTGMYNVGNLKERAFLYRAAYEGLLSNCFGFELIDELFDLFVNKLAASPVFRIPSNDKSIIILVVLKRSVT